MITEKDTIKCESIFNDDHTHRLYWKRVWVKDKPLATVIMLNPCGADNIMCDTTTYLVCNNIARLEEFGGVIIVNLFSKLTTKLNFRWDSDESLNDVENDNYIIKAAEESKTVVLAWGRSQNSNAKIAARAQQVIQKLTKRKEKLFVITDGEKEAIHPLTPSARAGWQLKPFVIQKEQKTEPTASTTA